MQIAVGYELTYDLPQPTPMLLTVNIHYSRAPDLVEPDHLVTTPSVPITGYRDLLATGSAGSSLRPGKFACQVTPSSTTQATLT